MTGGAWCGPDVVATIGAHGITARLPDGFEGRIFVRPATVGMTFPVGQFATFPIPDDIGDFGSGAVTLMGPSDVFATLFEYGPESVGTALFARQGRPTGFSEADFSPMTLRRGIPGQSGHPVVLHRGRASLLLLCRARQPRPPGGAGPARQHAARLVDREPRRVRPSRTARPQWN